MSGSDIGRADAGEAPKSREPKDGSAPIAPPTPLARRFVRYALGFSIGVAVGLAPYLGRSHVPGFSALLTLIPDHLHNVAIPLSSALMGGIAVWVQWISADHSTQRWIRRMFERSLLVFVIGLASFALMTSFVVERVPVPAAEDADAIVAFSTWFTRPNSGHCTASVSDAQCIKYLTLSQERVSGFWGQGRVRMGALMLLVSYFATTGAFGAMVGLLCLRDPAKPSAPSRARRRHGEPAS